MSTRSRTPRHGWSRCAAHAAALKDLAGQILDTGIAQHHPDLADALAVIAHWIAVTGDQQNGRSLLIDSAQALLLTWFSVASISR